MKISKIFLAVVSLLSVHTQTQACYNEHDLHYYMFSVYHQNTLLDKSAQANVKFWSKYTGGKFSEEDILRQLNNSGSLEIADNKILNYIKNRKDANGEEYLEKLKEMKKIAGINENSWNYPTKAELAQKKKDWEGIMKWGLNKLAQKRNTLYNRYVLMAVRGAFYSDNRTKMAEIWTQYGPAVKDQDIRKQCEGYMANEWLKNGLTEKAREFYAKSGYIKDMRATFPKLITLKYIKDLYAQYPNSVAFPYLLQDYLNSIDSDLSHKNMSMEEKEASAVKDSATILELHQFAKFAGNVVNTNGSKLAGLWKSAEAYSYYLAGDKKLALNTMCSAMKIKSPQRIACNTRSLILLIRADIDEYNDKFDSYMGKEVLWLSGMAKKEKPYQIYEKTKFRNHYTDVLEHIVIDFLAPKYEQMSNTSTAAVLSSCVDEVTHTQQVYNKRCSLIKRDSLHGNFNSDYSSYLFALLDTTPNINGVINYLSVLQGGGTATEQLLAPCVFNDVNYVSEIIATKLIRDLKFQSATEYLKKLPAEFVQGMNIYPYLPYDYNAEIWFNRHQLIQDKQKKKAASAKMNFCKYMIKQEATFEKLQAKGKVFDPKLANAAYNLATAYTQASYLGRDWALTSYSWTSVHDSADVANDRFINRAKAMIRVAYKVDTTTKNQIRCLTALTYLGKRKAYNKDFTEINIKDNDYDRYIRLLLRFRETKEFTATRLPQCDVLNNYVMGAN